MSYNVGLLEHPAEKLVHGEVQGDVTILRRVSGVSELRRKGCMIN